MIARARHGINSDTSESAVNRLFAQVSYRVSYRAWFGRRARLQHSHFIETLAICRRTFGLADKRRKKTARCENCQRTDSVFISRVL